MKLLLITFDFPPMISGISTFLYNMWSPLPEHDNLVLAPRIKGCEEIDREGVFGVIRYPVFLNSRAIRVATLMCYSLVLILKKKTDRLICGVPLSLGFIGLVWKKILGIPYCVIYWGGEYDKYRRKRLLLWLLTVVLKNADRVFAISDYSRSEVVGMGVDERKVRRLMPVIDTERFKPDPEISSLRERLKIGSRKVLLTVARLVRRKGVDSVINAVAVIVKTFPDVVYLIVGRGGEEAALRRLAKDNGLEDKVIFCRDVPILSKDLPEYYNLCDVYVMPNRKTEGDEVVEGFGISFIEASACAKPVIGGISGGVRDAVVDGITGVLVDPDDIQRLAHEVLRFLTDEEYAARIGRNGRERIEKEFGLTKRSFCMGGLFEHD